MNATLRTLALLIASVVVVTLGGELILLIIEEAADLALEATHALFLVLFERGFDMPHAKAEGLAAWLSAGLLLVLGLAAVWRSVPWIKRRLALLRNQIGSELARVSSEGGQLAHYCLAISGPCWTKCPVWPR